ncbi:MAG TPA: RluA family pseudouridine synthase [Deferrimonas sp.]
MEDIYRFIFDIGRPPERLDRFLVEVLPDLTRSQLKKLVDEGRVEIAGIPVKAGARLKGGEVLTVVVPPVASASALPQQIPLSILYEDRHLIVVDKPAGMVVHPAPGHQEGTLVNALLFHCQDLSGIGGELRPGIVHRLDRETSGVMVATKDDATHNHLAAQFHAHSITRRYVALVHGQLPQETGLVDKPIGRHPTDRKKMSSKGRAGRRAVTHWRVLRRFDQDRMTLVELSLETGRTHQIRVHFSEMNHPIVGDPTYGNTGRSAALADTRLRQSIRALGRQALHARILGFVHPASGEYLEFESPLPPDMQEIIDYLENKYRLQG